MSKYWILEPVAFVNRGKALYYRTVPSEPVEIDDVVADFLGKKVRRVDPFVEPFKPSPVPETSENENSADDVALDVEQQEPEEPPKPKRKRKVEEENTDGDSQL